MLSQQEFYEISPNKEYRTYALEKLDKLRTLLGDSCMLEEVIDCIDEQYLGETLRHIALLWGYEDI